MIATSTTLLSTVKSTQNFSERDLIKQLAKDLQKIADSQASLVANASIIDSGVVKQVEVNFGEASIGNQAIFSIRDSDVFSGQSIIANIAYQAPTDKDLDEIEMDIITCSAGSISDGNFQLLVTGNEGSLAGAFKINYTIQWQ